MIFDVFSGIILLFAIIKGYNRGLIIAVFSLLAFIIGLAAALKLSAVVAGYLAGSTNLNAKWLPFISFLLIFILVIILVRLVAKWIEKAVEFAFLGWLNRFGGIIIYITVYLFIFSIVVFYLSQLGIISEHTKSSSVTYNLIEPLGPKVINWIGAIVPVFQNMFDDLKDFFEKLSHKL